MSRDFVFNVLLSRASLTVIRCIVSDTCSCNFKNFNFRIQKFRSTAICCFLRNNNYYRQRIEAIIIIVRHNKWVNLSNFGTKTVLVPRLPSTRRIFFCLISRKSKRGSQEKKSTRAKINYRKKKERNDEETRDEVVLNFYFCFAFVEINS